MFQNLWENFLWLIGGGEVEAVMPVPQLILRAIITYIVALAIIRIGKRRFMGSYTTFDILLGFIVGSILSRAITGAVRFIDAVLVVGVLMILHWVIAAISYYSEYFGEIIKDEPRKLIVDGEIVEDALQKSKIGKNDLMQALREEANLESPEEVKTAYLERDGNITVIPKPYEPQIVEVKVENGVQTVKILIGQH